MRSWRSSGSSLLRSWARSWGKVLGGSLFLLAFLLANPVAGQEAAVTVGIQVTLVGITAYNHFQEIKAALSQSEGVEKVSVDSEAPGVIALSVKYEGEPKSLIDKLETFFPKKYKIAEKHLRTGLREIVVSKRGD